MKIAQIGKLALIGRLTFMGAVACGNSKWETTWTDEQISNDVLGKGQTFAKPYVAENFVTRRTMATVDKALDQAELTGYVVVTQPGVSRPLLAFSTFGPCYDAGTQITNPEQSVGGGATVPMVEPGTGVFPPSANGSGATRCVTNKGNVVQTEAQVTFSTAPIVLSEQPIYQLQEDAAAASVDVQRLKNEIKQGRPTVTNSSQPQQ